MNAYQKGRFEYLKRRFYQFFHAGKYSQWPEEEKNEYISLLNLWMSLPKEEERN